MNEKFYKLPAEKQRRILNAGYRVFSRNNYRKSPMSEIAGEAGISKSLLFHYFYNKKELYLFLWEEAARISVRHLAEYGCYVPGDLFEMMERGMRAKLELIREYPDMSFFVIKAYYEREPEISEEIQKSYRNFVSFRAEGILKELDPAGFIPGIDLGMMYKEMLLASEGYVWKLIQRGEPLDVDELERGFSELMAFWKQIYRRPVREEDSK
ncbi:MAG: TetR/AcrR family transcriptional regulator [Lachnospiraceae bacterium]|nr:TetR/AcrR family transcriptional regulator [Lachnospiraceae bacterium]